MNSLCLRQKRFIVLPFIVDQIYKMTSHRAGISDNTVSDAITAKAVAMVVLCLASLTMGLIPMLLTKWFRWDKNPKSNSYISMLLSLGGGVLLCTTFLHLLPEVSESIEELAQKESIPDMPFHLAELLMCAGFFTMYFVEEIVHGYIERRNKKSEVENVFSRTLSIRRGSHDLPSTISTTDLVSANSSVSLEDPKVEQKINHHSHIDHSHIDHSHTQQAHAHHSHIHHSEHGHDGHTHLVLEDSVVTSLRGLLIVLALSIHELFEGLAVGLESVSLNVWYMFGAVSAHKLVIAFCVGVELVSNRTRTYLIIMYVGLFAVVSPAGIGIGIGLSQSSLENIIVTSVILQGLASGTLLYVVFFEILQKDRTGGLRNFFSILVGFFIMFGFGFLSGHEHSHGHSHTRDELDDGHIHDDHNHYHTT